MKQRVSSSVEIESWFPNLFIPGAMKAGTTTLRYCLNQHPDIFMAADKEPNFFSNDRTFRLLNEYYRPLFEKGTGIRYRGEASVPYIKSAKAVQRIREWVPDPKFIFILRNPVDRAVSQYYFWKGRGFEQREFKEAFQASLPLFSEDDHSLPDYYVEGCYGRWLKQYLDTFGWKSVHIITTEALNSHPTAVINSCFTFLQLPPLPDLDVPVLNRTVLLKTPGIYKNTLQLMSSKSDGRLKTWYRKILSDRSRIAIRRRMVRILESGKEKLLPHRTPAPVGDELRSWVADFYREDVQLLENITGRRYPEWKDFY